MARPGPTERACRRLVSADTYHFPIGFTDEAFLRRAMAAMDRQLRQAWSRRSPDSPLTYPYQALILASIVEKETALPAERPEVAGVFARRLRRGIALQTDPTVIYGLGEAFDGNLRRADLTATIPITPIPARACRRRPLPCPAPAHWPAARQSGPRQRAVFRGHGDGGHVFSATLDEHNRAVRQYQLRKKE